MKARSSAARAGIQVGDVIVSVNGKRVSTPTDFAAALKGGTEVEIVFVNGEDGKAETRKVKVVEGGVGVTGQLVAVSEK